MSDTNINSDSNPKKDNELDCSFESNYSIPKSPAGSDTGSVKKKRDKRDTSDMD